MMSVLIKGMKMPVERQSFTITIQYNGLVFDSKTGIPIGEACELPPHGDLIDRNEYEIFGYTKTEGRPDTFDDGVMFMLDRIGNASVVIEAEDG